VSPCFTHARPMYSTHPNYSLIFTCSYAIAALLAPSRMGVIWLFVSVVQLTLLRLGTSVKSMQNLALSQPHQKPINRASAAGL
jgi:hypothetical protein